MSGDEFFLDTNVLIYLVSGDEPKVARSNALIESGGVVSVQVLNEFVSVAARKYRVDWTKIDFILATVKDACKVVPLTIESHERGLALSRRYGFAIYDAMIVAAAELAGCRILYTEDMHDGLVVGKLTLRNPYKPH